MKSLKLYAKYLKRMKAYDAICKDIKPEVLRELKKIKDGKASVGGVDFHLSSKTTRRYPKDIQEILGNLEEQITQQKKVAEEAGKVTVTSTESFDASIAEATKDIVLAEVTDFKKHFGINDAK
jgi:hypothetical protein